MSRSPVLRDPSASGSTYQEVDMEKPKILYALRPSSVLEVLDQSFRIYRDSFTAFVGVAALVIVPVTVLNYLGSTYYSGQLERLGVDLNSTRSIAGNQQFFQQYLNQTLNVLGLLLLVGAVAAFVQALFINGPLTYMASE